jgi:hypothetical protein
MKKIHICLYLAMFLVIFSCSRDEEPMMKQFPVIYTTDATNVNSQGATLNAEFLNLGYQPIIQYGFVYSTYKPTIDSSAITIINAKAGKGKFSQSVNSGLAGNMIYKVRAFAKTGDYIVYGNEIEFQSMGSTYNPWELIFQPSMDGWHDAHGISGTGLGYILFQSEDFYSFDPVSNTVSKLQNIPMDGNTGTFYASFVLSGDIFILSNDSEQLLKYNTQNNQWIKFGDLPFNIGSNKFFGFKINNEGGYISGSKFYTYNEVTHAWTRRADLPSVNTHSAMVVENRVYAIGDYKEIWMYDPLNDDWQKKTGFPGDWHGKIVGFTMNNKIYWGLSYAGNYNGAPLPATDMWEYDPELNNWKEIERFPTYHSQAELFTFSIGSLSYFGYKHPDYLNHSDEFMLFDFDPEKIK